ncbi:hypothetical protein V1519DRAFT_435038 [Lipomyces tetrasporus]
MGLAVGLFRFKRFAGFAYTISATILYIQPLQSADTIPDQDRRSLGSAYLYRQFVDYIGKTAKFINQEQLLSKRCSRLSGTLGLRDPRISSIFLTLHYL